MTVNTKLYIPHQDISPADIISIMKSDIDPTLIVDSRKDSCKDSDAGTYKSYRIYFDDGSHTVPFQGSGNHNRCLWLFHTTDPQGYQENSTPRHRVLLDLGAFGNAEEVLLKIAEYTGGVLIVADDEDNPQILRATKGDLAKADRYTAWVYSLMNKAQLDWATSEKVLSTMKNYPEEFCGFIYELADDAAAERGG